LHGRHPLGYLVLLGLELGLDLLAAPVRKLTRLLAGLLGELLPLLLGLLRNLTSLTAAPGLPGRTDWVLLHCFLLPIACHYPYPALVYRCPARPEHEPSNPPKLVLTSSTTDEVLPPLRASERG
jgi:hypothetical protein